MQGMKQLKVFFDEDCPFCLKVAERLSKEQWYFPVEMLPMRAAVKTAGFRHLAPHVTAGRFVCEDAEGNIYLDTNARLMVLYASRRYRSLSFRLAAPGLRNLVGVLFEYISNRRDVLSSFFAAPETARLRKLLLER